MAIYSDDALSLPPRIVTGQEVISLKELSAAGKSKIVYVVDPEGSRRISEIYSNCVFLIPRPGREEELLQELTLCRNLAGRCSSERLAISMEQFKGSQNVFLAERAEGDMEAKDFQDHLRGNFAGTVRIFRDACKSGYALHVEDIAHGDVKLENFLVFPDGKGGYIVKLSDWGKTKILQPNGTAVMSGNARHSPPEQLTSCKGDTYGLGLVGIQLFEIMLDVPKDEGIVACILPKKTTLGTLVSRAAASCFGITLAASREKVIHAYIDGLTEKLIAEGISKEDAAIVNQTLKEMTTDSPEDRCLSGLAAHYLKEITSR